MELYYVKHRFSRTGIVPQFIHNTTSYVIFNYKVCTFKGDRCVNAAGYIYEKDFDGMHRCWVSKYKGC